MFKLTCMVLLVVLVTMGDAKAPGIRRYSLVDVAKNSAGAVYKYEAPGEGGDAFSDDSYRGYDKHNV